MFALGLCAGLGVVSIGAPVEKPPTPEQVRAMVKKLEEPTWNRVNGHNLKPEDGPPPKVDFSPTADCGEIARAGQQAIPLLVELFEDRKKPGQARAQTVYALSVFLRGYAAGPDPRALTVLKAALRDDDVSVRWMACDVSAWVGKHGNFNRRALADLRAGRPVLPLNPPEKSALRPAEVKEILPLVVACIQDPEPAIAAAAIVAVEQLGEPDIGLKEIFAAIDRKEARVRIAAIHAISEMAKDHPKTFPAVLGRIKDNDETVRGATARVLAETWPDNQDAADAVIGLLNAPEHKVAFREAVVWIAKFGKRATPAVGVLTEVIKDHHDKTSNTRDGIHLYCGALHGLGAIGPAAKPAAKVILDHPPPISLEGKTVETLERIDKEIAKIAREKYQKKLDDLNKIYPGR